VNSKRLEIIQRSVLLLLLLTLLVTLGQQYSNYSLPVATKSETKPQSLQLQNTVNQLHNAATQAQALLTELSESAQLKAKNLDAQQAQIKQLLAAVKSYQQVFIESDFDSCFEDQASFIE